MKIVCSSYFRIYNPVLPWNKYWLLRRSCSDFCYGVLDGFGMDLGGEMFVFDARFWLDAGLDCG